MFFSSKNPDNLFIIFCGIIAVIKTLEQSETISPISIAPKILIPIKNKVKTIDKYKYLKSLEIEVNKTTKITEKIINFVEEKIYPKQNESVIEKIKNLSTGKNLQQTKTAKKNKHKPIDSAKNS